MFERVAGFGAGKARLAVCAYPGPSVPYAATGAPPTVGSEPDVAGHRDGLGPARDPEFRQTGRHPAAARLESIARFLDFVGERITRAAEEAREILYTTVGRRRPGSARVRGSARSSGLAELLGQLNRTILRRLGRRRIPGIVGSIVRPAAHSLWRVCP